VITLPTVTIALGATAWTKRGVVSVADVVRQNRRSARRTISKYMLRAHDRSKWPRSSGRLGDSGLDVAQSRHDMIGGQSTGYETGSESPNETDDQDPGRHGFSLSRAMFSTRWTAPPRCAHPRLAYLRAEVKDERPTSP